jgi:RNA polymerase sigma factor (sigma-70 family)
VFLAALIPTANREVSPDAMLVSRLLQKDAGAFEQLYDRHSRIVYGLLLRILQQAGTAEEVAQDVFLQLWRNAGQYDESRGPFLPWLLTLARNRALDTLRLKSERQRRREDQTEEMPPVGRVLQLWLIPKSPGGKPIPSLTLRPDADGKFVLLVSNPPQLMAETKALAITEEPAGGSPQPTTTPRWVGGVT